MSEHTYTVIIDHAPSDADLAVVDPAEVEAAGLVGFEYRDGRHVARIRARSAFAACRQVESLGGLGLRVDRVEDTDAGGHVGGIVAAVRDVEAANARLVRALAEARADDVDEAVDDEVEAVIGAAGEPVVLRRWQLADLLSYARQGERAARRRDWRRGFRRGPGCSDREHREPGCALCRAFTDAEDALDTVGVHVALLRKTGRAIDTDEIER